MPPPPKRRRIVSERGDLVRGFGRSEYNGPRHQRPDEQLSAKSSVGGANVARQRASAVAAEESSSEDEEQPRRAPKQAYGSLLSAFSVHKPLEAVGKDKHPTTIIPEHVINGRRHTPELGETNVDGYQESEEEVVGALGEKEPTNEDPAADEPAADQSDDENAAESFERHFANPDVTLLKARIESIGVGKLRTVQSKTHAGRLTNVTPIHNEVENRSQSANPLSKVVWKRRLQEAFKDIEFKHKMQIAAFGSIIFDYKDLLYCGRSVENAEGLRKVTCAHALNHVLKTRDRVIKNTSRLSREQGDADLELRDQGFTRPKILILLETRQACARYMQAISQIFCPEQQENKKRFEDTFVQAETKFSEDRPADFRELFEGNDDNEFRLGVKFTRKTIKYYSQFYNSDIILASPLGLRRAINLDDPKKADYDFLSSIEVLIIDQADAMLMQNWEHVESSIEHFNLQPKEAHGCDFSRVRQWYLHGNAKFLRQTIVFSQYLTPELNGLFSSHMQNVGGKVKILPEYNGAIVDMGISIRQTFNRYHSRSPLSDPDDRFKYFTTTIIPYLNRQLHPSGQGLGALIFIPSYLDFARVRNYFSTAHDTQNLTFGSISEYTDVRDSRRARSYFFNGTQNVMLYTGRAHHFRRYQLRGVRRVVMYGVPENPVFYQELVAGFLSSTVADGQMNVSELNVRVIFSKWDGLALERIVGTKRVGRMLKETGEDMYEFT